MLSKLMNLMPTQEGFLRENRKEQEDFNALSKEEKRAIAEQDANQGNISVEGNKITMNKPDENNMYSETETPLEMQPVVMTKEKKTEKKIETKKIEGNQMPPVVMAIQKTESSNTDPTEQIKDYADSEEEPLVMPSVVESEKKNLYV